MQSPRTSSPRIGPVARWHEDEAREGSRYAAKVIQASSISWRLLREGHQSGWAGRLGHSRLYRTSKRFPPTSKKKLDKIRPKERSSSTFGVPQACASDNLVSISFKYAATDTCDRTSVLGGGRFTVDACPRGMAVVIKGVGGPIKAGDLITDIIRDVDSEGKKLASPETTSTKGMTTSDAANLITGKPGTKVKVRVQREGHEGPLAFEVKRDLVDVETVTGPKRDSKDEWDYYLDPKDKIAYIRIASFARHTARDVAEAMKKLNKSGINGLILDVRENPGGLLTSAVDISDMFGDDGLIVTIRRAVAARLLTGRHEGAPQTWCVPGRFQQRLGRDRGACLQDLNAPIVWASGLRQRQRSNHHAVRRGR